MIDLQRNVDAREAMLRSIRDHLAASAKHDAVHAEAASTAITHLPSAVESDTSRDLVEIFRENLEAVGGHCIVVRGRDEAARALTRIIADLQKTPLRARRIALSNAPIVGHLAKQIGVEVDEVTIAPSPADLFAHDVGITTAQGAIAETGTLVLESECEKHRLVSLVPPVHIAILEAANICLTLGEALAALHRSRFSEMSPTITLITGPSRTADIELTMAIGVHGPQELFVIVNNGVSA